MPDDVTRPVLPLGPFTAKSDFPPYSWWQRWIIKQFHKLYYRRWIKGKQHTSALSWFGWHTLKCPLDLWMYQELVVRLRPDVIVETGTCFGGSGLYLAAICELLGHGRVVSIDLVDQSNGNLPAHPRLTYLRGSSVDPAILEQVAAIVGPEPNALVVLDSDHREEHVLAELRAYRRFVPVGGYLITEDTNVNGHPAYRRHGPGPWEAVQRFLAETQDFEPDRGCERFMLTYNPGGWLRRVR